MGKPPTKIERAMALLAEMSSTELDLIKAIANSRLDLLASQDSTCRFLTLPAELRNRIYHLAALDYANSVLSSYTLDLDRPHEQPPFGLALANKQISSEYLSILNSPKEGDEAASARYFHRCDQKWIRVDVRRVLQRSNPYTKHREHGWREVSVGRYTHDSGAEMVKKIVRHPMGTCELYHDGVIQVGGGGGSVQFFLLASKSSEYHL